MDSSFEVVDLIIKIIKNEYSLLKSKKGPDTITYDITLASITCPGSFFRFISSGDHNLKNTVLSH